MQKQLSTSSKYKQATHARKCSTTSMQKEVRTSPIFFGLWWHHKLSLNISPTRSSQKTPSFPPVNPTVAMDKTAYSGKLLQTFAPVKSFWNNLFRKFSKRPSPNHTILIPFPQNSCTKTLMFSSLQSPAPSTLQVLYHQASKLLLSNPCSNNPPLKRKQKRKEKDKRKKEKMGGRGGGGGGGGGTEKLPSSLKPTISV